MLHHLQVRITRVPGTFFHYFSRRGTTPRRPSPPHRYAPSRVPLFLIVHKAVLLERERYEVVVALLWYHRRFQSLFVVCNMFCLLVSSFQHFI